MVATLQCTMFSFFRLLYNIFKQYTKNYDYDDFFSEISRHTKEGLASSYLRLRHNNNFNGRKM